MNAMQELETMLCEELTKIAERGYINQTNLDTIQKLTSSLKNVKKIQMYSTYEEAETYRDHSDGHRGVPEQLQRIISDNKLDAEDKATLRRVMQMLNK